MHPNKPANKKLHKLTQITNEIRTILYQRFSLPEAALFLHSDVETIEALIYKKKISYTQKRNGELQCFGFELLRILFDSKLERKTSFEKTIIAKYREWTGGLAHKEEEIGRQQL